MNSDTVRLAALETDTSPDTLCSALDVVLPVLRLLHANASGWRFWIKIGLTIIIAALESYRAETCSDAR